MRTSSGPDPHIAYDAPTGTLSITKGHMHVHGSIEDIDRFASLLIRALCTHKRAEASVFPTDFIHELVAMDI